MSLTDDRVDRTTSELTYWPSWASAVVLVSGTVVVAVETTSWLVVLGLGFLLLGAYGLLVRGPGRLSTPGG